MILAILDNMNQIYFIIAVFFTVFYFLQSLLAIFGNVFGSDNEVGADEDFEIGVDEDIDIAVDEDFEVGVDEDFDIDEDFDEDFDVNLQDSAQTVHFLSIRSIISFFILFGWTGYLLEGNIANPYALFAFSFCMGLAGLVIMSYVIYFIKKLAQDGTVYKTSAIGKEADVYLKIPERGTGTGKVQLIVQSSLKTYDAISTKKAIETGKKVKVVDVSGSYLVVEEIKE